jgi:hypothetical protein
VTINSVTLTMPGTPPPIVNPGTRPTDVANTVAAIHSMLGALNDGRAATASNNLLLRRSGQSSVSASDGGTATPAKNDKTKTVVDTSLMSGGVVLPVQIVDGGVKMPANYNVER